jgi:hypothetical protein
MNAVLVLSSLISAMVVACAVSAGLFFATPPRENDAGPAALSRDVLRTDRPHGARSRTESVSRGEQLATYDDRLLVLFLTLRGQQAKNSAMATRR